MSREKDKRDKWLTWLISHVWYIKKRKACGEGKPEASGSKKRKIREEIGSKAYLRGEETNAAMEALAGRRRRRHRTAGEVFFL